jgi:uncharacterized delta-60 repeat protein
VRRVAGAVLLGLLGCTPLEGQPDATVPADAVVGADTGPPPSDATRPRAACLGQPLGTPGELLAGLPGWQRVSWSRSQFAARAMLPLPSGGWVVATYGTPTGQSGIDAALLRLTPDGRIDRTYGDNGYDRIDGVAGRAGVDVLHAATVDTEGRLLFGGWNAVPGAVQNRGVVLRLLPDGRRDPDFGTDGVQSVAVPGGMSGFVLFADTAGVVLAGTHADNVLGTSGVVVRLDAQGALDPGFGQEAVVELGNLGAVRDVLRDGDGYLLLASSIEAEGLRPTLLRLTATGALDRDFGVGGRLVHAESWVAPAAMHRDGDGVLIAGAYLPFTQAALGLSTLVRFAPTGADLSFGAEGHFTSREGFLSFVSTAQSTARQCDGALLVLQSTFVGGVALQRIRPDGTVDREFGRAGTVLLPRTTSPSAAGAVLLDGDGRSAVTLSYTEGGELGLHRVAL